MRDVAGAELQTTVTQDACLEPLLMGRYPSSLTARMAPLVHAADLDTIHKSSDFIGVMCGRPSPRKGISALMPLGRVQT